MVASASGAVDMVCALLDNGVDIDCRDKFGNSGLMLAAYHCHVDVVRLLLLRKADAELRDDAGSTALSDAAAQGSPECVKLLIEAGAEVNVRTVSGETPISRAVQSDTRPDVVELLLRAGADVELQDGAGRDAVSKSTIRQDGGGILKLILSLARPSKASLERALIYAAELGAKDAVETLLRGGATLAPDRWPMHVAIAQGDEDMVEFLLDKGAAKDQMVMGQRGTPLQLAVYHQQLKVVELLISRKVKVDYFQGPFHTALHVAAFKDTTRTGEFVQRLLRAGASVHENGGNWWTVLHAALWNTSRPAFSASTIAGILLEKDGNLRNSKDREGRLPLHIAARLGDVETMKLVAPSPERWLELDDQHHRNPLHFAAMGKGVQAVQYITQTFIADGNRVLDFKDLHEWTPLHWACREGQIENARFLMQAWSDIDLPTYENCTPRYLAIYHKKDEMLEDLASKFNATDLGQPEPNDNFKNLPGEYQQDILCSGCTCVCICLRMPVAHEN
jgi:ankyrin repeat protein